MSAMAVDNRQQSLLQGLPYESRYQAPQFTNPWGAVTSGAAQSQLYAASLAPTSASLAPTAQQPQQPLRPAALNLQYPGAAVSAAPLSTGSVVPAVGLGQFDLLGASQDRLNTATYGSQYAATSSPNAYAPATSAAYTMDYGNRTAAAAYGFSDPSRRPSHPSVASVPYFDLSNGIARKDSVIDIDDRLNNEESRNSFNEALEASRGMVSMSQSDITPRNIYGNPGDRTSVGSYGFPSTHSTHSSISGSSYAPSYYGSVDSSVTDYSSASESVDMNSRTLPRPSNLIGGAMPPAPQSMMGQFSSKVASSSQKKHKCKICDKRFTRPSSLQTHMYSHTGEKPFACEVEGCGRHFSVVSNLRRHRKVHKNDGDHTDDHPSPDD